MANKGMVDNRDNAIACLRILAAVAKADGEVRQEERAALEDAVHRLRSLLTEEETVDAFLHQEYSLDELTASIDNPSLQVLLYEATQAMAEIHGTDPEEQEVLDAIRVAFHLKELNIVRLRLAIEKLASLLQPDASKKYLELVTKRDAIAHDVKKLIFDYAVGISILGFNPFPRLNLVTHLVAFTLMYKMMRDIGAKWGFPANSDRLALLGNLFSGIGAIVVGGVAWASLAFLGVWIPFFSYFSIPVFFLTTTWAIGRATSLYYASGCKLDSHSLKKALQSAQSEGKHFLRTHNTQPSERANSFEAQLRLLTQKLKNNEITLDEYQSQVQQLL